MAQNRSFIDYVANRFYNELIGTVISVFFRFLVEIRLLPQTTPISPAQTTEPINIFRQRRQVKL